MRPNQVASDLRRQDQLFSTSPTLPSVTQLADAIRLAGRSGHTPAVHVKPKRSGSPPVAAGVSSVESGGIPPIDTG